MIHFIYICLFFISLVCAAVYIYMWHKHFDVNLTMIFTLVPVSVLGYVLYSGAANLEEAIAGMKIVYIGACFLQLFILFSIINLCGIDMPRWIRMVLFALSACIYLSVLTIGNGNLFYKNVSFERQNDVVILSREYGVIHSLAYLAIWGFFLAGIFVIVHSWFRRRQMSRLILCMLVIPEAVCVLGFFLGRRITAMFDMNVVGYILADIMYLLIAYRINLYDIGDTVIDSMIHEQGIGYLTCDFNLRYLGSNNVARKVCPELADKTVDEIIGYKPSERKIRHYLDSFRKAEQKNPEVTTLHEEALEHDGIIYNVDVAYLYDGNKKRGYLITFKDDTANRKYISLLDQYNEDLQQEVRQKTDHIVMMHDNLIMSLAMMVESRDNSTGGHIKRTSEGVRVLTEEIRKEGVLPLSDDFCANVVKAAPMHDLGKIAVDDAVLRKPGRFTPEEFEKMKKHAEEGARVIHEILLNTDDEEFKRIAENVAHFHHERWDGSGYPDGLKEEEIPVEARIMAIADVYDALVSKRVYKEAFDFAKADGIIMEGMGTQFDPALRSAYEKARPRLEEYYRDI